MEADVKDEAEVQVENISGVKRKLSVTVPVTQVEAAFATALRQVARQAALPGFRPGKAPLAMVERQFADRIYETVQRNLLEASLYPALDKHAVAALGTPQVTFARLDRKTPFFYTAEVEVRPEVTLQRWQGLAVPRVDVEVGDADVDAELTRLAKEGAQLVPVSGRNTVIQGDSVQLDYVGRIDGHAFEGGSASHALVEVGAGDYIPGFSEGLVGAEVPGTVQVPVTFPADYSSHELAGREAVFEMTLHELKAREIPALDDEFARDMGHEGLADLRDKVQARLRRAREEAAQAQRQQAATRALLEANPLEVPPTLVRDEAERLVRSATEQVERQTGRRLPGFSDAQKNDLLAGSWEQAAFQVRSALLLMAVGKAAGVQVTDEEVDRQVDQMAGDAGDAGERVRAAYDTPERREDVRFYLFEQRVLALLVDHSVEADAAAADAPAAGGPPTAADGPPAP